MHIKYKDSFAVASNTFEIIGPKEKQNLPLIIGILVFLNIILLYVVFRTHKRMSNFMLGKNGITLEDTIQKTNKLIIKTQELEQEHSGRIKVLEKKSQKDLRGLGIIRYNPFQESGSNQSFSLALTNEDGDGVVISSLYARERISLFAKPIKKNVSEYELTNEEKIALNQSKEKI